MFAGGYGTDIGVFLLDYSTGAITAKSTLSAGDPFPSFLAVRPGGANLYAVGEATAGRVGAYSIDLKNSTIAYLGGVSSAGNGPAFVSVDATGKWVMVANYGDGTTAIFPILGDGKLGPPTDTRSVGANAHMIAADATSTHVYVPCLGADYVAQFAFDSTTGKLSPMTPPTVSVSAGSGPRHLAFHPDGDHVYVINEKTSSVGSFTLDANGGLLATGTISTLPVGFSGTNTGAEIAVHPTGAWVYASNRGHDSIAVFSVNPTSGKLSLVGHTKTNGTTPRSFAIDANGAFLYVANQGTGAIRSFAIDAAAGTLSPGAGSVDFLLASTVALLF
jgi:6-phosphogluconolactonase